LIQMTVLTFLLGDELKDIVEEASKSLLAMPENIVQNLLKEKIHPKTLDFFARNKLDRGDFLETIVLNKKTTDETYAFLADKVSGKTLDILTENQQRMLRSPNIAGALKKNPNIQRSTIERIVSFLRMSGIQVEGESAMLTQEEINTLLREAEKQREASRTKKEMIPVQTPKGQEQGIDDEEEEDFYESEGEGMEDAGGFADEEFDLSDNLFEEKENVSEDEQKSIAAKISKMSVPQKVKIALLGNKEVRSILIKDSNKIVSTAVIKSPKLTDNEVHGIAQMRSVNDEIIRSIAGNNDWTKNYNIKLALVTNPKTPLPISMKFLRFLNVKDMADASRNKNISPQIQKLAKETYNKIRGAS